MITKKLKWLAIATLPFLILSCSNGGNDTSTSQVPAAPDAQNQGATNLNGHVIKGPYISGDVNVYQINTQTQGKTLIQSSPGAISNGTFNLQLKDTPSGIIQIQVVNGTYKDEITGNTVTNATTLTSTIDTSVTNITSALAITPLTTLVDSYAQSIGINAANIQAAQTMIETQFGLTSPVATTIPNVDIYSTTATSEEIKAGLVVAGLAQLANSKGFANANALITSLQDDITDGVFDGYSKTGLAVKDGNLLPIPQNLGSTQWLGGITQAANSGKIAAQGTVAGALTIISNAVAKGSATSATAQQQLLPSASGSVVVITDSNGINKLVLAKGKQISIGTLAKDSYGYISVSAVTTHDAYTGAPSWWSVTGGADGVVAIPTTSEIMAFSNTSSVLTFIDANTGAINTRNGNGQIDTGVTTTASFSGGSGKIVGAIFDGANGVWLATGDGYFHLNLANNSFDKKYYTQSALLNTPVAASTLAFPVHLSENFGYDATNGYIYSPDYTQVQVIDVNKYTVDGANTGVYQMDTASYTAFGSNFDAGAVDASTGFSMAMTEWGSTAHLLDLNAIVIDIANNSFSLPINSYSQVDLNQGTNYSGRLTGGVIEPSQHGAMWFAQGGSKVAVGFMDGNFLQLNDWAVFDMSSLTPGWWTNKMDPHGIVVTTLFGKAVGLLPEGNNARIAIIDIAGVLKLKRVTQPGGTIMHQMDTAIPSVGMVNIVAM